VTDWVVWHEGYDDPASSLSRRLAIVQLRLGQALDRLPPGPARLLSLCAGDGRDVLPVLHAHPRSADVRAVLVELDETLAARAEGHGAEVRRADAGDTAAFDDVVPVDVLLLCGIFGNVAAEDIATTVAAARLMTRPGGSVLWTRGAFRDGDLRPYVRRLFVDNGFVEAAYDGEPQPYGVGWNLAPDDPPPERPLPHRLFTFTR
jgi:hypothetical protein